MLLQTPTPKGEENCVRELYKIGLPYKSCSLELKKSSSQTDYRGGVKTSALKKFNERSVEKH